MATYHSVSDSFACTTSNDDSGSEIAQECMKSQPVTISLKNNTIFRKDYEVTVNSLHNTPAVVEEGPSHELSFSSYSDSDKKSKHKWKTESDKELKLLRKLKRKPNGIISGHNEIVERSSLTSSEKHSYPSMSAKDTSHVFTIPDALQVKVYWTRFWILGMFSFMAFQQTVIWGTFGPIMKSSETAFGWKDYIIAIMQSLGPLSVIVFIIPSTWFTQKYGLRLGVLGSISLMTIGTGIRCITSTSSTFTGMAIVAGVANGISGCIGLSLPAMVAATWFPSNERTTATAVGSLSAQLGGVGMYLSPLIVRPPSSNATPDDIKQDIMMLMYIEFAITLSLFICILIYFPNKPPFPPSVSSGTEREEYFPSIKMLLKNTPFLIIVTTFIFSFGIPVVWISIMNFSLHCIGIDQKEAMWIAICACVLSAIAAFTVARITDYLYGYLRISIIVLLMVSSLFFFWFLLLIFEIIPTSVAQVYITVAGGISLEYATVPLLIEFGVELAYPCSEGVVGALLTGMFNVVASIFLLLFIIPSECYYWVTYVLVGCTSLTVIPLFFVKETHKRSSLDRE